MASLLSFLALFSLLAFLAGFTLGGLVEALALSIPRNQPLLSPPRCQVCDYPRSRWSWVLPFRCPLCRSFPTSQLVVQLLAGLIVSVAWPRFLTVPLDALRIGLLSLLLLLIARIDWAYHLIYLITIVPGLVIAGVLALLTSPSTLLSAAGGAVVAILLFVLFYGLGRLLYRQAALGSGDILLATLIGAATGIERVLTALFAGMVIAAIVATWLLLRQPGTRRRYLPYGAFLSAGAILTLLFWGST